MDWAENGQTCVEKFERSPIGHYDAILMDARIPVMDGHVATTVIRRLEREDTDVPHYRHDCRCIFVRYSEVFGLRHE